LRREDKPATQVRVALWVYSLLVASVTATSWIVYTRGGNFSTRPLFAQIDQYRDLLNYLGKAEHLGDGAAALGRGFPVFNYPPPAAYVYKVLICTFPGYSVQTYISFLVISVLGFALVAWRACGAARGVRLSAAAAIATTACLGYPMWFTADRGNIEGVVWVFSAAGICFLLRARYRAAALLIGLAASIKPFSIVFLLLLLPRRKYKEAALGLATAGLFVIAALTALGPNPWKAYQQLQPNATFYMDHYMGNLLPVEEARFTHSLLDGMKSAALSVEMGGIRPGMAITEVPRLMAEPGGWHEVRPLAKAYPFVTVAGLGLLLAVFYRMPLLNQLTALGAAATLFPPVASEYTLLHLYVPFGVLLVFLTREVAVGRAVFSYASMLAFAVLYGLLFAPLTFLKIYAGDAKLLLLLALLCVAARSPMPSAYFSDPPGGDATGAGAPAEGRAARSGRPRNAPFVTQRNRWAPSLRLPLPR
jgi:hypothetical protein